MDCCKKRVQPSPANPSGLPPCCQPGAKDRAPPSPIKRPNLPPGRNAYVSSPRGSPRGRINMTSDISPIPRYGGGPCPGQGGSGLYNSAYGGMYQSQQSSRPEMSSGFKSLLSGSRNTSTFNEPRPGAYSPQILRSMSPGRGRPTSPRTRTTTISRTSRSRVEDDSAPRFQSLLESTGASVDEDDCTCEDSDSSDASAEGGGESRVGRKIMTTINSETKTAAGVEVEETTQETTITEPARPQQGSSSNKLRQMEEREREMLQHDLQVWQMARRKLLVHAAKISSRLSYSGNLN